MISIQCDSSNKNAKGLISVQISGDANNIILESVMSTIAIGSSIKKKSPELFEIYKTIIHEVLTEDFDDVIETVELNIDREEFLKQYHELQGEKDTEE